MQIKVPLLEIHYTDNYGDHGRVTGRATLTVTYDGGYVGEIEIDAVKWDPGDDRETIENRERDAKTAWLRGVLFPPKQLFTEDLS